jgi:acetyltransferase-like isoleucine patch superfamily enzyme
MDFSREFRRYLDGVPKAPAWLVERLAAVWFLRACDTVGANARCIGRPDLNNRGRIRIGADFKIRNDFIPVEITCQDGAEIEIGSGVSINYGALICARQRVVVGDNVLIGNLSIISDCAFPMPVDGDAGRDDAPKSIEIGDQVWLAARVTVLPGSRIGRGSVIGAGSIVSGDIPAGVIAMGNPARPFIAVDAARDYAAQAGVARARAQRRPVQPAAPALATVSAAPMSRAK